MARNTKTPTVEQQMEALKQKRLDLAHKRHEADAVQSAATAVVDGADERRQAVMIAEARGDKPTETVEQVDRERHAAQVALADARQRSDALRVVAQEITAEEDAVIDQNPGHYRAEAVRKSEEAEAALGAALDAAQAANSAWMAAYSAWGEVRKSCKRREVDPPPQVPVSDLGSSIHELATQQHRTWPGGSRENWERFLQREGIAGSGAKVSNSEAAARFEIA